MLSLIGFRVIVRQNVLFTIWCKIVKPCPSNGLSINNYRLDISLVVFVYISLSLSFWLSFVHPCCPVEAMVCLESITARTSLSNWLVIDGSIPPSTPSSAQCTQCTVHTILCTLLSPLPRPLEATICMIFDCIVSLRQCDIAWQTKCVRYE